MVKKNQNTGESKKNDLQAWKIYKMFAKTRYTLGTLRQVRQLDRGTFT